MLQLLYSFMDNWTEYVWHVVVDPIKHENEVLIAFYVHLIEYGGLSVYIAHGYDHNCSSKTKIQ
jgi:hypothetical protein